MSAAALSRWSALLGVGTLAVAPAAAVALAGNFSSTASRPGEPFPAGPLTIAQAEAIDFAALWASLPPEAQARISVLAVRHEVFMQLADDGGFHLTDEDRGTAQSLADDANNELPSVVEAALPTLLPTVYDEPYPLWQVLDKRHPPATVDVRGIGRVPLVEDDGGWFAAAGGVFVELGGAVDLDSRDDDAPCRWLFWTVADIDTERDRRHPEMAGSGWTS